MHKTVRPILAALLGSCLLGPLAHATEQPVDAAILQVQQEWAHINYEVPAQDKSDAYTKLERQETALVQQYPGRPEPLIWQAITLSTHAGVKGGLSALGMAKDARKLLEQAETIDPTALQGSIYTSLGSLYYKVPGWPLGFGYDVKAESFLKKALAMNPGGIDPNYFYGDFLYGQKRYQEAAQALQKALQAPDRAGRALADKGRREEVRTLLSKVQAELGETTHAATR
jgi:tetratricopeptide (TPR) repeat protein